MAFEGSKPDLMYRGQPFWLIDQPDHRTLDGRNVKLKRWQSFCAECGERFECTTPGGENVSPKRRCDLHKGNGRIKDGWPLKSANLSKPEARKLAIHGAIIARHIAEKRAKAGAH